MKGMDDNELKGLFRECVEGVQQEIRLRKLKQAKRQSGDELERNSQQENKLSEYRPEIIKVTKFDQKQILES